MIFRTFRMGPFDGQDRVVDESTLGLNRPSDRKGWWDCYQLAPNGDMIWQGRFNDLLGGMFDPLLPAKVEEKR